VDMASPTRHNAKWNPNWKVRIEGEVRIASQSTVPLIFGVHIRTSPLGDANFSGKIPARSPVNRPVSLNQ